MLPKLSHPIFELKLPSTKQVVKYRPFLVREEKLLLMAQTSEDPKDILNSIKQVISNCLLSDDVNVDELATFDIEYLFVKIRSKSVNNIVSLTYRDLEDDQKYTVEVDLDSIEVKETDGHSNVIPISDNTGITLSYPRVDNNIEILKDEDEATAFFKVLKSCIKTVYQNEKTYEIKDYSDEEVDEFVSNLDVKTFKKIEEFFTTMPKLYHEIKYTNSLGKEKVIPLTTLSDFFTLG